MDVSVAKLAEYVGTSADTCCQILTSIAEVPTQSEPRRVSVKAAKLFLVHYVLIKAGVIEKHAATIIRLLASCLDGATGVVLSDARYVVVGPDDRVFDLIESKYITRTDKPVILTAVFIEEIWKRFQGVC